MDEIYQLEGEIPSDILASKYRQVSSRSGLLSVKQKELDLTLAHKSDDLYE